MTNKKEKSLITKKYGISIMLIFMVGFQSVFYYLNLDRIFDFKFSDYSFLELWRYLLSCFCSKSLITLLFNIVLGYLLLLNSERKMGSVGCFFDILFKNFFINLLSLVLFVILRCCHYLFQSIFTYYLQFQNGVSISGLVFVFILELFLILVEDELFSGNFLINLTPKLLFIILSFIYFVNLHFLSAIILALLVKLKVYNLSQYLSKAELIFETERTLINFAPFLFLVNEDLIIAENEKKKIKSYFNNNKDNEEDDLTNFVSEGSSNQNQSNAEYNEFIDQSQSDIESNILSESHNFISEGKIKNDSSENDLSNFISEGIIQKEEETSENFGSFTDAEKVEDQENKRNKENEGKINFFEI